MCYCSGTTCGIYLIFICYLVECFPTHVRTSAMGVLAAAGRLGAVSAQFVNGSLEQNIPLLLFVTSACTVVGGMAAWLLPHDTSGYSMAKDMDEKSLNNVKSQSIVRNHSEDEITNIISPLANS